jgi:hypothetical protein
MLRRSDFIDRTTSPISRKGFWRISRCINSALALGIVVSTIAGGTMPILAKDTPTNQPVNQSSNQQTNPQKKTAIDPDIKDKAATAADKAVGPGSKDAEYTFVFPTDGNYGTIYEVPKEISLEQSHPKMRFVAAARGVVHLKGNLRIIFEGNALLAQKPELLAQLPIGTVGLVLRKLDLSDQAFANAAKLTNTEYLSLEGTEISDQSLKIVAGFHGLRFLEISSTQVNGSGFGYLKACPRLSILRASHDYLTDWRGLEDLSGINWLDLSHSGVNDAALVPISKMKMLDNLEIPNSKISNAGLKLLQSAKRLRSLDIRNSTVTGEGLFSLSKLPLRGILITPGQIKGADKSALLKLFPRLTISEEKGDLKDQASELFAPLH